MHPGNVIAVDTTVAVYIADQHTHWNDDIAIIYPVTHVVKDNADRLLVVHTSQVNGNL